MRCGRGRLDEVERNKPVYVICQILAGYGYEAYNFAGGFRFYEAVTRDRCLVESTYACGMDQ